MKLLIIISLLFIFGCSNQEERIEFQHNEMYQSESNLAGGKVKKKLKYIDKAKKYCEKYSKIAELEEANATKEIYKCVK